MKYSPAEKNRIETLLSHIAPYVAQSHYFDIVNSRFGYLAVYNEETFGEAACRPIRDADTLLQILFEEVTNDIRDFQICGEHDNVDLYPQEVVISRELLSTMLHGLEDEEKYLQAMEEYLASCAEPNQ